MQPAEKRKLKVQNRRGQLVAERETTWNGKEC